MQFAFVAAAAAASFITSAFATKDLLFVNTLVGLEQAEATALNFTTKLITESQWRSMNTTDFAAYKAIIIGDPYCSGSVSTIQFLEDTKEIWSPAVTGNIIVHGSDQSFHDKTVLIDDSIKFAAGGKSASGIQQTGLYLSLSCYYNDLNVSSVGALSYFGDFQVRGQLNCYNEAHIVASSPAIDSLTDEYLSDWDCSVHEAFSAYPSNGTNGFEALAIADGVVGEGTQNYADGTFGLPYIISRGATPAGCGDGHWDPSLGEECDDGNTVDGDGCSKSCKCESGLPAGNGTCLPAITNTTITSNASTTLSPTAAATSNSTLTTPVLVAASSSSNSTLTIPILVAASSSSNSTLTTPILVEATSINATSSISNNTTPVVAGAPTTPTPITTTTLTTTTTTPKTTTTLSTTTTLRTTTTLSSTHTTLPSSGVATLTTLSTTLRTTTVAASSTLSSSKPPLALTSTTTKSSTLPITATTAASQSSASGNSANFSTSLSASSIKSPVTSKSTLSSNSVSPSTPTSVTRSASASATKSTSESQIISSQSASSVSIDPSTLASTTATPSQNPAASVAGSTSASPDASSNAASSNAASSNRLSSATAAAISASNGASVSSNTVAGTVVTSSGGPTLATASTPKSSFVHQVVALTSSASGSELAQSNSVGGQIMGTATGAAGAGAPTDSSASSSTANVNGNESVFKGGPLDRIDYFGGLYLCVIVTVLFKSLWGAVFASTKMIEPFYQLSKDGGASAEEALCSDYLSSGLSLEAFKNFYRQHWVMGLTSSVYVLSTITLAVASESMRIRSGNECTSPTDPTLCNLQWIIEVRVVRTLEALLGLTSIMILFRIVLAWGRPSGITSYPCNLASMAALLSNSDVIDDFRNIDPKANSDELAKGLSGSHYTFGNYETSPGLIRYGLMKVERSQSSFLQHDNVPEPEIRSSWHDFLSICRSISWKMVLHLVFTAAHVALFGLFLGFQLQDNYGKIFNKERFGPRFIFTIITSLIAEQWKRIEREVRIMTPYRKLNKPNRDSRDLIAMSLHGIPLKTFPYAIWYGNFFHAYIAFVAILGDILVIAVAGIPYNFGVIQNVSMVSSSACVVLLGIMIFSIILVSLWRWSNPQMPRKPETLAKIWMMLCASKMLDDFDGLEHMSSKSRELAARTEGRRYWFGTRVGVDGKERAMVDEDDLEWEDSE